MDDSSIKNSSTPNVPVPEPAPVAAPETLDPQVKLEEIQKTEVSVADLSAMAEKPKTVPVIQLFAPKEEKMFVDSRLTKSAKSWGTNFAPLAPGARGKMGSSVTLSSRLNAMKRPAISSVRTPRGK